MDVLLTIFTFFLARAFFQRRNQTDRYEAEQPRHEFKLQQIMSFKLRHPFL